VEATSALRARHATPSIVIVRSIVATSGVAPAVTNQPSGVRSAWSGPAAPVATSSSGGGHEHRSPRTPIDVYGAPEVSWNRPPSCHLPPRPSFTEPRTIRLRRRQATAGRGSICSRCR
jgi:hypothetical protein